jgi:hypothetical protein
MCVCVCGHCRGGNLHERERKEVKKERKRDKNIQTHKLRA